MAGEGAADVIALGSTYLGWMAVFYALPALTNGFQGFYRGMGKMTTTLIGTCLQAGLRAAAAAVLAPRVGLPGIAFACAFGWCVMLAFEVPYYFWTCREWLPKASPSGLRPQARVEAQPPEAALSAETEAVSGPARRLMRAKLAATTRSWSVSRKLSLIRPCGATFPPGGRLRKC